MIPVPRSAACLLAFALCATGAAAAPVTVRVENVETSEGEVLVSLCAGGLAETNCSIGLAQPARAGALSFRFPNIPPGVYAVAAVHDLNGNRRLDRSPIGLPIEPYGFSNGVGRTAPPRFDAAAVEVEPQGGVVTVTLGRIAPPKPR